MLKQKLHHAFRLEKLNICPVRSSEADVGLDLLVELMRLLQ